jgi:peptidoglycan/LPS O-acetylase OafA/YrhL
MPTILMMMEAVRPQLARIPALDGLRGLAVLAVMLFHFESRPLLPGGAFGVDLFLALSGYLITGLLLNELRASGSIDLKQFYVRRALRLMPALAFLLLGLLAVAFVSPGLGGDRSYSLSSLLTTTGYTAAYVINWAFAFGYHQQAMVVHLWSLSLEEQFYLLWPGLVLLLARADRNLRLLMATTGCLIVASLLVPYIVTGLSWQRSDWDRLYFGSDFRAHGLLLGSLAAQFAARGSLRRVWCSRSFTVVTAGACVFLLLLMMTFTNKNPMLFIAGGFALLSISCSIVVLYAGNVRDGLVAGVLSLPALRYLGLRSYALYLWHKPIAYWLSDLGPLPQVLIGMFASLAIAELSFRLVETPALKLRTRHGRGQQSPSPSPGETLTESRMGLTRP